MGNNTSLDHEPSSDHHYDTIDYCSEPIKTTDHLYSSISYSSTPTRGIVKNSRRRSRSLSNDFPQITAATRRHKMKAKKQKLLAAKVELNNMKTEERESELFAAVIRGDVDTVMKLIEYDGIDVNCTDGNYLTALHYAAMYTRVDLVQYLIDRGADVDGYDMKGGFTPLHWVVINSSHSTSTPSREEEQRIDDCIMSLARGGCNINCKDFNQATPLHMAARTDNKSIVDTLMRLGANPNDTDVLGRTCAAVAKSSDTKILIIKLADLRERAVYHTLQTL